MVLAALKKLPFYRKEDNKKESETLSLVRDFIKIEDLSNGILKTRDGYRVGLELGSRNFDLESEMEQDRIVYAFAELARAITFAIQPYIQSRPLNITEKIEVYERAKEKFSWPLNEYAALKKEQLEYWMKNYNRPPLRYFLIIPYDTHEKKQEDVLEELNYRRSICINKLVRCGIWVKQLSTDDFVEVLAFSNSKDLSDSNLVKNALAFDHHSLFVTSEGKAPQREGQVLQEGDKKLSLKNGVLSITDLIMPDGTKLYDDCIHVGPGRWVRSFYFAQIPGSVKVGWFNDIFKAGDIDLSIHIVPRDDGAVIEELNGYIKEFNSQLNLYSQKNISDLVDKYSTAKNSSRAIREEIQFGENRMYAVSVFGNLGAGSREELDEKYRLLKGDLAGRGIRLRTAFLEANQAAAYCSVIPLGKNYMPSVYRDFDLVGCRGLFYCTSADLSDPNGYPLGENMHTGGPVFYNEFTKIREGIDEISNYNLALIAESGAGKSTLVKITTANAPAYGIRVGILDWDAEYSDTIALTGGVEINLYPGSGVVLNLFDVREHIDDKGNVVFDLLSHVLEVKALLYSMMVNVGNGKEITPEAFAVLEEAIKQAYADAGFKHGDVESLYEEGEFKVDGHTVFDRRRREAPILSKVYDIVEGFYNQNSTESIKEMLFMMHPFLDGNSLGMFDGQTNVDIDNAPTFSINLSRLEENVLRPAVVPVVTKWVEERFIKSDRFQKKRFIAEEGWVMDTDPKLASFSKKLSKRVRKYTCSFWNVIQSATDALESKDCRHSIKNASTKILMRQGDTDLDIVAEALKLSEGQYAFVNELGVGEALLITGKKSLGVSITRASFEESFASTTYTDGE